MEESQPVLYGRAAVDEYLDGTPGRLMRSLKSLLGSSLMQETTAIGTRNIVYADIVMLYLRTLRERACAEAGRDARRRGPRPPGSLRRRRRSSATARRSARSAACAREAGFRHVEFQFEPIAAAFDYERTIEREESVLIVDVGGGTADFTVIRLSPARRDRVSRADDVLANDGIHIAGTDFDSRLNMSWVMPTLGYRSIGPKGLVVPSLVYFDLSTWHRINLIYAPKFLGTLRELQAFFARPHALWRLMRVVDQRLGHLLLGRTEQAKIELSEAERDAGRSRRHRGGPRSARAAPRADRSARRSAGRSWCRWEPRPWPRPASRRRRSRPCTSPAGSSGMTALREAFAATFAESRVVVGDLFGSVVSGLGLDAGRRFA